MYVILRIDVLLFLSFFQISVVNNMLKVTFVLIQWFNCHFQKYLSSIMIGKFFEVIISWIVFSFKSVFTVRIKLTENPCLHSNVLTTKPSSLIYSIKPWTWCYIWDLNKKIHPIWFFYLNSVYLQCTTSGTFEGDIFFLHQADICITNGDFLVRL